LAGRRLEAKGAGTRDQMASIALWAVPAGIIGARLYHVVTDWQLFRDDPWKIVAIWEGGLGIWGGIGLGVAVGVWRAHRMGIPLQLGLDAVVPALPLAQAIGRLGNWWNQELFGRPTTLPWGLEISIEHRPVGYEQYATFHPTFLYEALWNLALMALLIWIDKKGWLRPGRLILVYVAGYTFARFFIEGLRIDSANKFGGLRVNEWVSLVIFVIAVVWLVVDVVRHRNDVREITIPDAETAPTEVEVAAMAMPETSTAFDDAANALVGTGGGASAPAAGPDPAPSAADASTGESAANRRCIASAISGGRSRHHAGRQGATIGA